MRRSVRMLTGCLVALIAFAFVGVAIAASDSSTVTVQGKGGQQGVDLNFAPVDQQPACLIAIGGFLTFTYDQVAHANQQADGSINVWGNDRMAFTVGNYTASANFSYSGNGFPDANNEVLVTTLVNVDFTSATTPGVVKTTFRFTSGAQAVPGLGLAPFSAALPFYTDIVCR